MQLSPTNFTRVGRVASELMQLIGRGAVGDRLPPERELCLRLKVSRPTLRKAMEELRRTHVLESIRGSGTFIQQPIKQTPLNKNTRTLLVGLSVPTLGVPAMGKIVSGAERRISEMDGRLVLIHDDGDPAAQAKDIRKLVAQDVDGLIIFLDRDNIVRPEYISLLAELKECGKPIVLLDRYVPDLQLPCVLTDTVRGMKEATEHLILSGRRRFAVLSWGESAGIADRDRMAGFRAACTEHGISPEPVLLEKLGYGESHDISSRKAVANWLTQYSSNLPFDAIVCFYDKMAHGAFQALREHGVRVPEDIAIVGFDNIDSAAYRAMGLDLTSVEQPFMEMGRIAGELVMSQLSGQLAREDAKHHLLAPRLIVRTSCGSRPVGFADSRAAS